MISNIGAETAGHEESLGAKLTHHIQVYSGFDVQFGGYTLHISETIITMWAIMAVLILAAFLVTRKLETYPGKVQNVVEAIVDGVNSLVKSILGHHWRPYAPYFGTIILFLAVANTLAMFNIPQFRPPTKDVNLPAALALMSILLLIGSQLRYKGIGGSFKSLFEPMWIIFPFKILDYFTRPLSLCLRLFGNIFGAFVMMELIILATRNIVAPPIFSLYFDIFDGLLQAFIFTFLSMLYIAEAIE